MIGHAQTPEERERLAVIVMREQMRSIMQDIGCSAEEVERMEASVEVREVVEDGELLFGFDVPPRVHCYLDALRAKDTATALAIVEEWNP